MDKTMVESDVRFSSLSDVIQDNVKGIREGEPYVDRSDRMNLLTVPLMLTRTALSSTYVLRFENRNNGIRIHRLK